MKAKVIEIRDSGMDTVEVLLKVTMDRGSEAFNATIDAYKNGQDYDTEKKLRERIDKKGSWAEAMAKAGRKD